MVLVVVEILEKDKTGSGHDQAPSVPRTYLGTDLLFSFALRVIYRPFAAAA